MQHLAERVARRGDGLDAGAQGGGDLVRLAAESASRFGAPHLERGVPRHRQHRRDDRRRHQRHARAESHASVEYSAGRNGASRAIYAAKRSRPMTPDDIRARIRAALPDADVSVADTTGGGDHFDATVVSSAFAGKGPVERHRLVYAALERCHHRPERADPRARADDRDARRVSTQVTTTKEPDRDRRSSQAHHRHHRARARHAVHEGQPRDAPVRVLGGGRRHPQADRRDVRAPSTSSPTRSCARV